MDDVESLQACVNGLIDLLALSAVWTDDQPGQHASTLLDALVRLQRLDFACLRLRDPIGGAPTDTVRWASNGDPASHTQALVPALGDALAGETSLPRRIPNPMGEGEISISRYPLGVHYEVGALVVGSSRTAFPTQTEALVLRVAANQVAMWLGEAKLVAERKRIEEDLAQPEADERDRRRENVERDWIEAERSALREELAAELAGMTHLHKFSTRLLASTELQPLLQEVLTATIALQNADFGNIQLYNPATRSLEIVASRGFRQDFLEYFDRVDEDSAACGRALQRRKRVIIEDVITDPGFAPHRRIAESAGFRAVQSTP